MQICHNDEAEIYRTQIRRWIADNLPPDWHGIGALSPAQRKQFETDWTRIISAARLVAPTWPVDYGGAGLTTVQAVVLDEELVRAGIMIEDTLQKVGVGLSGPTLLASEPKIRPTSCRGSLPASIAGAGILRAGLGL